MQTLEEVEEASRLRKERIAKLVQTLKEEKPQLPPPRPLKPAAARQPASTLVSAQVSVKAVAPKSALPPAPRSPVKDRVSSTLLQRERATAGIPRVDLEERAKIRRERAALLQREAENRVRKQKTDEKCQQDDRKRVEEAKFAQFQQEHKQHVMAQKENAAHKEAAEAELRQKWKIAVAFYNKQLLIRRGIAPLMRLVEISRNNWFTAANFSDDFLLQQSWVALYGYCANRKKERIRKEFRQASLAMSHYKSNLLQSIFRRWSLHRKMLRAKAIAVTGHFSRFTANRRAWRAWRDALEKRRRQAVTKMRLAKPLGDRCVCRHSFGRWLEFLKDRLVEVEVDYRAASTWQRLQEQGFLTCK